MKRIPVFFCLFCCICLASSGIANTPDSATSNFIHSIQQHLFNDQYQSADSLCDIFMTRNAKNPVGYLFKAGTLLGEMSDLEEPLYSEKFRKIIDSAIYMCDSMINSSSGNENSYLYLWRGHAHVYRSLFESRFGSFTSAIKHGFKAKDDYESGLIKDSSNYDLYFGLGNYHYWKSVKAGFLRTIGIVSNDIEKGLKELRLASDSGLYFSEAARNSMIWIYLDRQEYDSTIAIAKQMLDKFPQSRTLLWPLAEAYFEKGEFNKSAETYEILLNHFDRNRGNYFNLIECEYHRYECLKKLREKSEADKILINVNELRSSIPKETQRRQLSKLNYLRRELAR